MKHIIFSLFLCLYLPHSFAANFSIEKSTAQSPGALGFDVYLDTNDTSYNVIAGEFVFSDQYVSISQISTKNSFINFWVKQPKEDTSVDFSSNKIIPFEGVIPGGFSGVRSPYYVGTKKGLVFHIEVFPKKIGTTGFSLSNLVLYKNDGKGTSVDVPPVVFPFDIKTLAPSATFTPKGNNTTIRTSSSLTAYVFKHTTLNNKWAVIFKEDTSVYPVDHFEVTESIYKDPSRVATYLWTTVSSPYVLNHQARNYFIHIKAVYIDSTQAIVTIPPVDNINTKEKIQSILTNVGVLGALVLLYVTYNSFVSRRRK